MLRIRWLFVPWILDPRSGMGKKSGSGINNPDNISKSFETFFWFKYSNFLIRILENNSDPESKMEEFGFGIRDKHPGSGDTFIGSRITYFQRIARRCSGHLTGHYRHGFWQRSNFSQDFLRTWDQCSGSMTFWGGSGSADPCLWLMDPDLDPDPGPAIFVIDLQDASEKLIF